MPLVPPGNRVGPTWVPGADIYADSPDSLIGPATGPFASGGSKYVVSIALGGTMAVDKRASDLQWSRMDTANEPALDGSGGKKVFFAVQNGSVLQIVHTNAPSELCITEFDMATDTWGSTVAGGPSIATGSYLRIWAERLSTGAIKVYYSLTSGTGAVYRAIFSSGTWGSPVTLTSAHSVRLESTVIDATDRVHVFYSSLYDGVTPKTLFHQAEDDTGSFTSELSVATDVSPGYYNAYDGPPGYDFEQPDLVNAVGAPAQNGTEVLIPYVTNTTTAAARISLSSLAVSTETISATHRGDYSYAFGTPAVAAVIDGAWHVYFFENLADFTFEGSGAHNLYRTQNSGSGWSTESLFVTTAEPSPSGSNYPYTYALGISVSAELLILNAKLNSTGDPAGGPNGLTVYPLPATVLLFPYSYLGKAIASCCAGVSGFSLLA